MVNRRWQFRKPTDFQRARPTSPKRTSPCPLSFLALPVIPELKLTNLGLVDVMNAPCTCSLQKREAAIGPPLSLSDSLFYRRCGLWVLLSLSLNLIQEVDVRLVGYTSSLHRLS